MAFFFHLYVFKMLQSHHVVYKLFKNTNTNMNYVPGKAPDVFILSLIINQIQVSTLQRLLKSSHLHSRKFLLLIFPSHICSTVFNSRTAREIPQMLLHVLAHKHAQTLLVHT